MFWLFLLSAWKSQECSSSAFPWGVDSCCTKAVSVFSIHRGRSGGGVLQRHMHSLTVFKQSNTSCRRLWNEKWNKMSFFLLYYCNFLSHFILICAFCGNQSNVLLLRWQHIQYLISSWMVLIHWFPCTCRPHRHMQKTHICCINTCKRNVDARDSWGWPDPDPTCPTHHKDTRTCVHVLALSCT